jgi:hypothetical protein
VGASERFSQWRTIRYKEKRVSVDEPRKCAHSQIGDLDLTMDLERLIDYELIDRSGPR